MVKPNFCSDKNSGSESDLWAQDTNLKMRFSTKLDGYYYVGNTNTCNW